MRIVLFAVFIAIGFPWTLILSYISFGVTETNQLLRKVTRNRNAIVAGLIAGTVALISMSVWFFKLLKM